jgi:hypothetical protein
MFFSVVAIAAGAVMYWAVTTPAGHGFRYSRVGVILMIVGGIGFVASAAVFATSRQSGGVRRSYHREAVDSDGSTVVYEEVR